MTQPRVELLWWEGCPSHPQALEDLREAMAEEGLDPGAVQTREVRDQATAERERFIGSPTIRLDGRDIAPTGDEHFGLDCRVYKLRDGRISPVPDLEDLRAALRRHRDHST